MLSSWLISTDLKSVDDAEYAVKQCQANVRAQRWLLKHQADELFRRKDALFCAFLGGCAKGLTGSKQHRSHSSLLGLATTLLKFQIPSSPEP